MRRSRVVVAAFVLEAVLLLLPAAAPASAAPRPVVPACGSLRGPGWVDGTYMLGDTERQARALAARLGPGEIAKNSPGEPASAHVGMEFTVNVSDMDPDHQGCYPETFVVQSVGRHGIVCVTKDAYDGFDGSYYHFANPGDPAGADPWLRTEDLISSAQLSYLLQTFDTTIWNTESAVFGTPLARGAEGQKVWILVYNLKDEAYYHWDAATYVAGYFSAGEDGACNQNMIHIDTYDWAGRTGPNATRPYLYEGVFAHEYQHLLHADADPDEEAWVDEGMADLAAFLCGFMKDNSHVFYYIMLHPYTSLTCWAGGLENYGADYLFQLYLWENYGGNAFTKALFHDQANGIQGVQNELSKFGRGVSFNKVFDDWTLANYFDRSGPSQYGYKSINLGPDTYGWTIPSALTDFWGAGPLSGPFEAPASAFWGAPAQPYTAQYYLFNAYPTIKLSLDGDDKAGVPAHGGQYEMISGQDAWAWKSLSMPGFAVPGTGASLSFWTWFECEPGYDYGYVEICDHGLAGGDDGQWFTMPVYDDSHNLLTISDSDSAGQLNPNVPAGRNPTNYSSRGAWNAFNGSSSRFLGNANGWVHGNVDLSSFANHTIDIYFRTWQDGTTTLPMLYLDDVFLSYGSVSSFDGFEGTSGQWLTPNAGDTGAWSLGTGLVGNNWQGTLVSFANMSRGAAQAPMIIRQGTNMDAKTQAGSVVGLAGLGPIPSWLYIVSNRVDHSVPADYALWASTVQWWMRP